MDLISVAIIILLVLFALGTAFVGLLVWIVVQEHKSLNANPYKKFDPRL